MAPGRRAPAGPRHGPRGPGETESRAGRSGPSGVRGIEHLGGLVMIGDSTTRHVYLGLLNVISDDYAQGAVSQHGVPMSLPV